MKNKKLSFVVLTVIAVAVGSAAGCKSKKQTDFVSSNLALLAEEQIPDIKLAVNDTLLFFENSVADLGRMKLMQKKDVTFKFENVYSKPVVITKVLTTCGCTSAEWEKAPLMPGEKSEIKVKFEAETEGVFFKKLFVYCAGVPSPLEIAIKGEIK